MDATHEGDCPTALGREGESKGMRPVQTRSGANRTQTALDASGKCRHL
jgi:hypothetical protein